MKFKNFNAGFLKGAFLYFLMTTKMISTLVFL